MSKLLQLKNYIVDLIYIRQTTELAKVLENLHIPDPDDKLTALEGIAHEMSEYLDDLRDEIQDAQDEIANTSKRLTIIRTYLDYKRNGAR